MPAGRSVQTGSRNKFGMTLDKFGMTGRESMLDIKFLRENPQVVQKAAKDKGISIDVNHILEIDAKYRELSQSVQKLREERNKA